MYLGIVSQPSVEKNRYLHYNFFNKNEISALHEKRCIIIPERDTIEKTYKDIEESIKTFCVHFEVLFKDKKGMLITTGSNVPLEKIKELTKLFFEKKFEADGGYEVGKEINKLKAA